MLFSGPRLNGGRERLERRDHPTTVFNSQSGNSGRSRFENSVAAPPSENSVEIGIPSVAQSAALGETVQDLEQYRQYLIRNHYEWRALYARMLVERNYNYQSNRRKENINAVNNTSMSEDEILDQGLQNPPNTSTPAEALAEIPANGTLAQSTHFPNVDRMTFWISSERVYRKEDMKEPIKERELIFAGLLL